MEKIKLLEYRGKVLKFNDFVNERMEVEIDQDFSVGIKHDEACIKSVWSVIEQICGGDVDALMKYISDEYDIANPTSRDLILYIMGQVDDYFNNGIVINDGEQYIKQGKVSEFIDALMHIDYKMCVETLIMKLYKVEQNDENPPQYVEDLLQLVAEYISERE